MAEINDWLKVLIKEMYKNNTFVHLLEMNLISFSSGMSKLSMPVKNDKHTNIFGICHGGAIASLADAAMGVACASLGKRVVTIDLNINYTNGAIPNQIIMANASVLHDGNKIIVVECEIINSVNKLIGKSRGTFYVVGTIEREMYEEFTNQS